MMQRVCAICKRVYGCYPVDTRDSARDCDHCRETDCPLAQGAEFTGSTITASHGLCDACFRDRAPLSFGPSPTLEQ